MSRLISDLVPELQVIMPKFDTKMKNAGIDYIITCTKRTDAEQLELYKKGRVLRNGIWVTVDPKLCVTWTLDSNHKYGKAFDAAIMVCGKILWNPDLDTDKDGVPEYTEMGLIGESLGLKWGGRFKNSKGQPRPDAPHFEL